MTSADTVPLTPEAIDQALALIDTPLRPDCIWASLDQHAALRRALMSHGREFRRAAAIHGPRTQARMEIAIAEHRRYR